jgi:hypothetical protein
MRIKSIENNKSRILGIKFCNLEKGSIDFLLDNPFVFEYNNQLAGLVLLELNKNLSKAYRVPGLSKIIVLNSSSNQENLETKELHRFSLDSDYDKVPPYLVFLLETVSRKGYGAYKLDF